MHQHGSDPGAVRGSLGAPPPGVRFSPDDPAGGGDPASGDGQSQPGQPDAVSQAQLDAITRSVMENVHSAIGQRFGRLESTLSAKIESTLTGAKASAASTTPAKKDSTDGRLEQLERQFQESQRALETERKSNAIQRELAAAGISGVALADATTLLMSQVEQREDGSLGGTIQGEFGDQPAPLKDVVQTFLKQRPQLLPAPHKGGSGVGSSAQRGGTPQGGKPSSLLGLSDEEIMALDPKTRLELAAADNQRSDNASNPFLSGMS